MLELMLETIKDNLANGYKRLEKGTFQEAAEIQIQRRSDNSLRNNWFYTANLPLFRMNDGILEYGLSGRKTFDAIAGADIQDFTAQILENGVFRLTQSQKNQLEESSSDIVWAKADELGLKKDNDEWSYFPIRTSDLNAEKLNASQRLFAAKAHGSMDSKYGPEQKLSDYGKTMEMLRPMISQTRIWLPTQNHITKYVKEGDTVARASWLGSFGSDSVFGASDRGVDFHDALRGVRKGVAEGDSEKIDAYKQAYNALRTNPGKLTPEMIADLSQLVADHLNRKQ